MPINMPPGEDYIRFLPELIMTAVGTFMMVLEGILGDDYPGKGKIFGHLTLLTLIGALGASVYSNGFPGTAFSDMGRPFVRAPGNT